MSEYYIKQPDTDHARGPLTIEQLASLAETGTVTQETLLYDETKEKWKPLSSYRDLLPQVFPEKKRIQLKRDTEKRGFFGLGKKEEDPDPDTGVNVESILAAAEGKTSDTKHKYEALESMERAANIALPGLAILLAINGVALGYPEMKSISALLNDAPMWAIFTRPFLLFAVFDIFCAVLAILAVSETFPLIRVRAGLGLGFFGFTFWAWSSPLLSVMAAIVCLCMFLVTTVRRDFYMKLSVVFGIVCAIVVAWFSISGILSLPDVINL
ncbi:MAG: GYF domain-containing protein [Opitutales bacterium]|nr:GYF domain-containing protein [Opitutales bacterium]